MVYLKKKDNMLKDINFKYLLFGRLFLNLGDSLAYIIFMWYAYSLSQDSLYTGIASFIFNLAYCLLIFWGPVVDRNIKQKLLIKLNLFILAALVIFYILNMIYDTSVLLLLIFLPFLIVPATLTYPVEESLLPKMIVTKDLTKANSLLSIAGTGADLLFNAISAIIIGIFSFQQLILIMISIVSLALFNFSRIKYQEKIDNNLSKFNFNDYINDLKIGLNFVKQSKIIIILLPLIFLNIGYAIFYVALPEFSNINFINPSSAYGLILSLLGIGSLIGSSISEYVSQKIKLNYLVGLCYLIAGIAWILSVVTIKLNILIISVLLVVLSGMANGIVNVIYSVLFQLLPPKEMIARVNTINMTLLSVLSPIFSIFGGFLVKVFGSYLIISSCGVLLIIISVCILLSKTYVQVNAVKVE